MCSKKVTRCGAEEAFYEFCGPIFETQSQCFDFSAKKHLSRDGKRIDPK